MIEDERDRMCIDVSRRRSLRDLLSLLGIAVGMLALRRSNADVTGGRAVEVTGMHAHEALMAQAFDMRRKAIESGDQPYGAIVVKRGEIVGEGPSKVVVNGDPTAHAEMEAIRDAARRLGTRDLSGCVLYASSRPCRMCETAAYWASISRVYFGSGIDDGGRPGYSGC